MVAILLSEPGEKAGHLEIRDRPVGVKRELEKIRVLLGIERSHVMRRIRRRVRPGSPFEKPDGFGNSRVGVARRGVRERRRVETLPENKRLKVPGLGKQAVQFGGADAWQAANDDRRQQSLLQDVRVPLLVGLKPQAIREQTDESILRRTMAALGQRRLAIDRLHELLERR